MTSLSPREIVSELDRFIIGQDDAKRAVAVALRNRWRRRHLQGEMRDEVYPKNILMIGPTGVGKTEIARRLARLSRAPFLKVEATKFTEIGYVGRDVESIIRDLVEIALREIRARRRQEVRAVAESAVEKRLLEALVGDSASEATHESFRAKLRSGELEDREIDIEVTSAPPTSASFELPAGTPGAIGAIDLSDLVGKAFAPRPRRRTLRIDEARELLLTEEADRMLDAEQLAREAVTAVEESGIVFVDEIDKVCANAEQRGGEISREGVQRDLLPLIEGTAVATRYGTIHTDHVLFIASGAFHVTKPKDLLPELQGRLPIRVELSALSREEFARILTEPDYSLTKQYAALLATEGVTLEFTPEGIEALAGTAAEINRDVENIGARRLHTVLERLLEDVSFQAPEMGGETVTVDAEFVTRNLQDMTAGTDLGRYIL